MLTAKYTHPEYEYSSDNLSSLLEVGQEYEVVYISMGQSYTYVYIKGFHDPFNSILFDFFEDGEEINIYKSSKYNPYIKGGTLRIEA